MAARNGNNQGPDPRLVVSSLYRQPPRLLPLQPFGQKNLEQQLVSSPFTKTFYFGYAAEGVVDLT